MSVERRHSSVEYDPVSFGMMVQSVDTLTREIAGLRKDMESIKRDKWIGYGVIISIGAIGGLLSSAITNLFK